MSSRRCQRSTSAPPGRCLRVSACATEEAKPGGTTWRKRSGFTSSPTRKRERRMEYICEHLFQALTQTGKLTQVEGWNPFQNATAKDGTTSRALFCDSCAKNYNDGHVRMAKEPVLA